MDSSEYYKQNAAEYYEKTVNLNLQEYLERFLEFVPEGGEILDLGCGSGRDSAYFISKGYLVTPIDASEELCSLASVHTGMDVLHMSFSEIDFEEVFDGVWANASLLHVSREEMRSILFKIIRSLKDDGVIYMTFRYGEDEGMEDGRYYVNYRTREMKELISQFTELEIIEIKKYEDVREDRDNLWIHALVRKSVDHE